MWLHRTRVYGFLAAITALAPFGIALMAGRTASFHWSGVVVGAALLVAGALVWTRVGAELRARAAGM